MQAMSPRASGVAFALLFSASTLLGQAYEIARQFILGGGTPRTAMVAASDGNFYGTDYYGGEFGAGTIFRMVPDGSGGFTYELLWSFHGPDGDNVRDIVQAADSKLYGVSVQAGELRAGTAFVFDPSSASLVRLHSFVPTSNDLFGPIGPSRLVQAADGQFYGVVYAGGAQSWGGLFRLSPSGDFSVLHDFYAGPEGVAPFGALLQASDGFLYGVTSLGAGGTGPTPQAANPAHDPRIARPDGGGPPGWGTIYRADLSGAVTPIHVFSSAEAMFPNGDLIEGLDGVLYGTAYEGGTGGVGTIFRCDKSGNFAVIFNFPSSDGAAYPSAGLTRSTDGSFYGTTLIGGPAGGGVVFRITPAGDFTTIASFPSAGAPQIAHPVASVTLAPDGSLWGTAADGGFDNAGGVFRIPLPDTGLQILHENGINVAAFPVGVLAETPDGTLWGTAGGGALGLGTVFSLAGGPRRPVLVHDFAGPDGAVPHDLWAATDGNLYGTTSQQGPNGAGTVFRIDSTSGALTTLHGFAGADGSDPEAGVIQATDGNLYGTTSTGGAFGVGTLFRMDLAGSLTTLADFGLSDEPSRPIGRLLQAADGDLYGASVGGGAEFAGTVYRSTLSGGLTTLHSFGTNGEFPTTGLIQAADGNFYAASGFSLAPAAIYRIDSSGTFAGIYGFAGADGPQAPLLQASDGRLYGTTAPGASVFRLDLSGQNFETLRDFGTTTLGGLMQASDGMLYGAAASGGWGGAGLVYRLDLNDSAPSIASLSPTSGRAAGGVIVTIAGDHFHPDLTTNPPDSSPFDTHTIFHASPAFPPGSLNDYTVTNADSQSATLSGAFFADFLDAPGDNQFHAEIEAIFRAGITAGCGGGSYCTDAPASRAQMAVLLLKVEHGPAYAPPPCAGIFPDVVCPSLFADWIEQFAAEELTAGCGGGNYCPQDTGHARPARGAHPEVSSMAPRMCHPSARASSGTCRARARSPTGSSSSRRKRSRSAAATATTAPTARRRAARWRCFSRGRSPFRSVRKKTGGTPQGAAKAAGRSVRK